MNEERKNASKEYCPDDAYPFGPMAINIEVRKAFIAGAEWDRSQMLKEAVEGEFQNTPFPTICLDDCKDFDFKDGDKVRIVILPKED